MTSTAFWTALSELGLVNEREVVLPEDKKVTILHRAGQLKIWGLNGDFLKVLDEIFIVSTYGHDRTKIGSDACFDIDHVYAVTLSSLDE